MLPCKILLCIPTIGKRIKTNVAKIFEKIKEKTIFFLDFINEKILHLINVKKRNVYGNKKHNKKP